MKSIHVPDPLIDPASRVTRSQYPWSAGQEATVGTGHGTTDWFQIGKGVPQGCLMSPCLFNMLSTS